MIQQDQIINEVWRSVTGYINYQVSNIGRVRNCNTGRILKNCIRNSYYRVLLSNDGHTKNYDVHQLVANEFTTKPETDSRLVVDHIDRNRLNNQISNLRYVSYSQNCMNSNKQLNTSSKYKGVCFHKQNKKWKAQIQLNNKKIHIGYYDGEIDAARAYNTKAVELFGEYACLNKFDDDQDISPSS